MNLFLCLDDKNGMLFNHRRQSMDRILREDMLAYTEHKVLWMSPYTAGQFAELPTHVRIADDPIGAAGEGAYCFVERNDWTKAADQIQDVIVYRWNRVYPAGVRFPQSELDRRRLINTVEFVGSSHDRITREIYRL